MDVKFGNGKTVYGPGVEITLDGNEVVAAIHTYLTAHDVHIDGARTIRMNGELFEDVSIYVDPSGQVNYKGKGYSGKGKNY